MFRTTSPTQVTFLGGKIMSPKLNLDPGPCGGNSKVPSSWGRLLPWKCGLTVPPFPRARDIKFLYNSSRCKKSKLPAQSK